METRYCIEYVNPRHPLRDNGSINVRYDRVLTLEQAEHDLTLILSFGGKILDLYMGNVVEGETGEWSPKPMIIDDDDWFSTKWLNTLEVKEVDTWHLQEKEDIYDAVKDWGLYTFVCIMKDGTIQRFNGSLDEDYEGHIHVYINGVNDDYDNVDDIVKWIEFT